MSKRISTIKDFQLFVDREIAKLEPAHNMDYLNYQGSCVWQAFMVLRDVLPFHDNFKTFFEDSDVQDILLKHYGIKRIMETYDFLEKKARAERN